MIVSNNTTNHYHDYYDYNDFFAAYYEFMDMKTMVSKYLFVVFLLVGTFGNITCALCMIRYCKTAWSVCFYLILSMIFGLIELYMYCGNFWFHAVSNRNLTEEINILSNAVCKVYNFFSNVILYFNSWVMVAISIETMITVVYPKRMYKMCSVEKAKSIVLFITVLVICINLHYFWTMGLSRPETNPDVQEPICHDNYQPQMADQVTLIVPVINLLVDSFFPFVIVTIAVIISLHTMITKKRDIQFELKKYVVDIKTLEQLLLPMVIMLLCFSPLKASHCSEHIMRFVQVQFQIHTLDSTIRYFHFVNVSLTYFFISFKPVLFIVLSKQLRQDSCSGLCTIFRKLCLCQLFRKRHHQPYITPETPRTKDSLISPEKQENGELRRHIKCTNV